MSCSLIQSAILFVYSFVLADVPYSLADIQPMANDLFFASRVLGTIGFALLVNFFNIQSNLVYYIMWFTAPIIQFVYHLKMIPEQFCCSFYNAFYIELSMLVVLGLVLVYSLVTACCCPKKESISIDYEDSTPAPSYLDHNVMKAVIEHVKRHMKDNDASHDVNHVMRVWVNAREITRAVLCQNDEKDVDHDVIELAALLHDMYDPKYVSKDEEKHDNALPPSPKDEFTRLLSPFGISKEKINRICEITQHMSFKESIRQRRPDTQVIPVICSSIEFKIVRDADWLDAIGAIGLARLFTFGGAKKRRLFDASVLPLVIKDADTYHKDSATQSTTINHIYEKLLFLSYNMSTLPAQTWASERRMIMTQFMEQFFNEMSESADTDEDLESIAKYERAIVAKTC